MTTIGGPDVTRTMVDGPAGTDAQAVTKVRSRAPQQSRRHAASRRKVLVNGLPCGSGFGADIAPERGSHLNRLPLPGETGGEANGLDHTFVTRAALASDIERGTVVDRGANDW